MIKKKKDLWAIYSNLEKNFELNHDIWKDLLAKKTWDDEEPYSISELCPISAQAKHQSKFQKV